MRGKVNSVSGDNIKFIEKEYDSATVYNEGDTALIKGVLYSCLVNNTTGTLNMDRWERVYLSDLAEITSSEQALADMVDEVYDPSKAYNKGDTALYNEVLHICKNDGTTGKWNADLWEQTTLVSILNSNLSNYIKTEVLYNGAGGTVNLTIPAEFKNGTLIVQASHDNRTTYACLINGKTPVYTYRGTNYLQSYFGMDVDIFQLSEDTSLTVAVQCSGFTVTVIDKKVTPTYISTEVSLNASKDEDYLCIYTRDYRNAMNVNVGAVSCSNLRSAFSSTEALYGVYGTWYCHNCATFCTIKDTAITIGGDLVLWLKI